MLRYQNRPSLYALLDQRDKLVRLVRERAIRDAKLAHPETEGSQHLIHNWGNEQAKLIWFAAERRIHYIYGSYQLAKIQRKVN